MQRLCRGFLVLHHGDANVAKARIGSVGLVAREIAARDDAQPRFAPQPERGGLITALRGPPSWLPRAIAAWADVARTW